MDVENVQLPRNSRSVLNLCVHEKGKKKAKQKKKKICLTTKYTSLLHLPIFHLFSQIS